MAWPGGAWKESGSAPPACESTACRPWPASRSRRSTRVAGSTASSAPSLARRPPKPAWASASRLRSASTKGGFAGPPRPWRRASATAVSVAACSAEGSATSTRRSGTGCSTGKGSGSGRACHQANSAMAATSSKADRTPVLPGRRSRATWRASIAATTAPASWKRRAGLGCSRRSTSRTTQAGRSSRTVSRRGGACTRRWVSDSAGVPPENGGCPASIS